MPAALACLISEATSQINSHTPTHFACTLTLKVTKFYMAKGG